MTKNIHSKRETDRGESNYNEGRESETDMETRKMEKIKEWKLHKLGGRGKREKNNRAEKGGKEVEGVRHKQRAENNQEINLCSRNKCFICSTTSSHSIEAHALLKFSLMLENPP